MANLVLTLDLILADAPSPCMTYRTICCPRPRNTSSCLKTSFCCCPRPGKFEVCHLLLVPTSADLEIYSPWAVSQRSQILNATFQKLHPLKPQSIASKSICFRCRLNFCASKILHFFFEKSAANSRSKVSPEGSCFALRLGRMPSGGTSPLLALFQGQLTVKKNAIFWSLRSSCGRDFTPGLMQYFAVSRGELRKKVAFRVWVFCQTAHRLKISRAARCRT